MPAAGQAEREKKIREYEHYLNNQLKARLPSMKCEGRSKHAVCRVCASSVRLPRSVIAQVDLQKAVEQRAVLQAERDSYKQLEENIEARQRLPFGPVETRVASHLLCHSW